MFNKLTDTQWRCVYAARAEWLNAALCTDPADRTTTERILSGFYRRLGKAPPKFIWFDGPLSASVLGPIVMALLVQQKGTVDQLRDQLWGQLGDQLRDQLRGQLGDQLWDQLRDQLWDQLGGWLGDQLWDQLWGQLGDQLRDQLWDQLRDQLRGQLGGQLWDLASRAYGLAWAGGEWSSWIAHSVICRDLVGVRYTQEQSTLLDEWARLSRASGWWFPSESYCFCAERHKTIRFDDARRLHCPDGPAVECRDGFKVFAWHGTRVPAAWIENPKEVDVGLALTWDNIEQRRALAEILGWGRVLEKLSPIVIDKDPDPQIGTLLQVDLPDAPAERFLRARCGTGREFVIPVPKQYQTALEANAATYNVPPQLLRRIEVRT